MTRREWISLSVAAVCVMFTGSFTVAKLMDQDETVEAAPSSNTLALSTVSPAVGSACGLARKNEIIDEDYTPHREGYDTYELRIGGKGAWWPRHGTIRVFHEDETGRSFKGTFLPFEYIEGKTAAGPNILPFAEWLTCEHRQGNAPLVTQYWFQAKKNTPVALAWTMTVQNVQDKNKVDSVMGGGNIHGETCQNPTEFTLTRNGQDHPELKPLVFETGAFNYCPSPDPRSCALGKRICLLHIADTPTPCPPDKLQRGKDGCSHRSTLRPVDIEYEKTPDGEWLLQEILR